MDDVQESVESCLPILSAALEQPIGDLEAYWRELQEDREFLSTINAAIRDVPEFSGKTFRHPQELRPYRCMLYIFTRATRPDLFVETGVHNGMGTCFSLLAMRRNRKGTLHSIDLPPTSQFILDQGNRPMPEGKAQGWMIPDYLKERHRLHVGAAQVELPFLLQELGTIDAFLHDSDHSYQHMMFEMGLVWDYLRPGGWLLCDNIEANPSFDHFAEGMGGGGHTTYSFNTPSRVWKHGLLRKPIGGRKG